MSKQQRHRSLAGLLLGGILTLGLVFSGPAPCGAQAPAGEARAALDKPVPEDVADLLAIQTQVQKVLPKALACTVGIQVGRSSGSGVIINEEGYVLTAGHVAAGTGREGVDKGREVTIILPDGKKVKGETLGINFGIDSGLIKITEKGEWPFAPMGKSGSLKTGQWCLALGHPGGFKEGRPPVVRLGRIMKVDIRKGIVLTDCALVGGDSGGPLFDLDGNVIGIHSRISESISTNIHVPVDTYHETWDRLAKGDVWGWRFGRPERDSAYFGIILDTTAEGCVIKEVTAGSPADRAGIEVGDKIIRFDREDVRDGDELRELVEQHRPGERVRVVLVRGSERVTLTVTLGERN